MPARVVLQDFTGVPCVVDLAAMRDAVARLGGKASQINPLIPSELVIDHSVQVDVFGRPDCAGSQRQDRVRAQQGALRLPALGPEILRQFQGGAAQHRHRPPGQPGEPGPGGDGARGRRRAARVPGHGVRHRFAHHHDQRHRRARLGRGRHRGRGRDARPAFVDADPAGGRLQADRQTARRRHRHRPGADRHPDAAQVRRGRQVRRVLRRRPAAPAAGRSRHHRQHGAGIRRHLRHLPGRCRIADLPAPVRPQRGTDRAGRSLCEGPGPVARARPGRSHLLGHPAPGHGRSEAVAGRPQASAGSGAAGRHEGQLPRQRRRHDQWPAGEDRLRGR